MITINYFFYPHGSVQELAAKFNYCLLSNKDKSFLLAIFYLHCKSYTGIFRKKTVMIDNFLSKCVLCVVVSLWQNSLF